MSNLYLYEYVVDTYSGFNTTGESTVVDLLTLRESRFEALDASSLTHSLTLEVEVLVPTNARRVFYMIPVNQSFYKNIV